MTALLIILILLVIFAAPTWPYNGNWGYGPVGLLVVVILILLVLGYIP